MNSFYAEAQRTVQVHFTRLSNLDQILMMVAEGRGYMRLSLAAKRYVARQKEDLSDRRIRQLEAQAAKLSEEEKRTFAHRSIGHIRELTAGFDFDLLTSFMMSVRWDL